MRASWVRPAMEKRPKSGSSMDWFLTWTRWWLMGLNWTYTVTSSTSCSLMKSGAKLHLGIGSSRAGAGAAATGAGRVAGPVVELASWAAGVGGGTVAGLGGSPSSQGRAATPATVSSTIAAATDAPAL